MTLVFSAAMKASGSRTSVSLVASLNAGQDAKNSRTLATDETLKVYYEAEKPGGCLKDMR